MLRTGPWSLSTPGLFCLQGLPMRVKCFATGFGCPPLRASVLWRAGCESGGIGGHGQILNCGGEANRGTDCVFANRIGHNPPLGILLHSRRSFGSITRKQPSNTWLRQNALARKGRAVLLAHLVRHQQQIINSSPCEICLRQPLFDGLIFREDHKSRNA